MFKILVPADGQPRPNVPRGAALLAVRGNRAMVNRFQDASFGERCSQATRNGTLVLIDFEVRQVGVYDEYNGEVRPDPRYGKLLADWNGGPLHRNDLEANDNRASRRAQARRLTMQGRHHEAFRLDRRMGL